VFVPVQRLPPVQTKQIHITVTHMISHRNDGNKKVTTRMSADAQRDGRPADYRWRPLQKFRNSIPCTIPQSLAEARC